LTRVLFVCTANQARSAFAEAILRSLTAHVEVSSAGTQASAGHRSDANSLTVASQLGFDLSAHRATRLNELTLQDKDLVLCMTNEHLRHTVGLHTKSWPHTFTLIDFVRRASIVGPRSGNDLSLYLEKIHAGRAIKDAWVDGGPTDVPDPIERSANGHRKIFEEIRELTMALELFLR
jgi:protein-tyrosine-phosphatase